MSCIVTIDYQDFIFKKDSDAAKVIALFASCIAVDHKEYAGRTVYFPKQRQREISMKSILPNQIFASDPTEARQYNGPRQLNPAKL